jgi:hypothetical protein
MVGEGSPPTHKLAQPYMPTHNYLVLTYSLNPYYSLS